MKPKFIIRSVRDGWAGWVIAHPDFGRIEGFAGQCAVEARPITLGHPYLDSY